MPEFQTIVGIVVSLIVMILSLFVKFIWAKVQEIGDVKTQMVKLETTMGAFKDHIGNEITNIHEKDTELREHQKDIQKKVDDNNNMLNGLRLEMRDNTLKSSEAFHEFKEEMASSINGHFQSIQEILLNKKL